MRILSLFLLQTSLAKVAKEKGVLSISHRGRLSEFFPVQQPTDTDNIPDFIIMGVNKCGTTAASFFLSNHPEVQKARGEPNFFNLDSNYEKGFEWYSAQFPPAKPGVKTYEKTPGYYKSIKTQRRIKAANKNIKLVNVGRYILSGPARRPCSS